MGITKKDTLNTVSDGFPGGGNHVLPKRGT